MRYKNNIITHRRRYTCVYIYIYTHTHSAIRFDFLANALYTVCFCKDIIALCTRKQQWMPYCRIKAYVQYAWPKANFRVFVNKENDRVFFYFSLNIITVKHVTGLYPLYFFFDNNDVIISIAVCRISYACPVENRPQKQLDNYYYIFAVYYYICIDILIYGKYPQS